MADKVRVITLISGRVQAVGFRYWTEIKARDLGLTGYVKNLSDGRVEAVFEGNEDIVEQMLELLKKGPSLAEVTGLRVERDEYKGDFDSFSVAY